MIDRDLCDHCLARTGRAFLVRVGVRLNELNPSQASRRVVYVYVCERCEGELKGKAKQSMSDHETPKAVDAEIAKFKDLHERVGLTRSEIDKLFARLAALQAELTVVVVEHDRAFKALREIGERAVVDWQEELVGFVHVGLGTADWNSVVTMEQGIVETARRERDAARSERDTLSGQVAALRDVLARVEHFATSVRYRGDEGDWIRAALANTAAAAQQHDESVRQRQRERCAKIASKTRLEDYSDASREAQRWANDTAQQIAAAILAPEEEVGNG